MNALKTTFLLGLLTVLMVMGGMALGGQEGMIFAFIFAVVMNFGAYFYSDKLVLSMYKAQPVTEADFPEVYGMVRELSRRAGIPMPKVYRIPSSQPNAFATGRNPENAAVAFTDGILHQLDNNEFMGVMAHEIAHVKNRDILLGTITATLAGAISMLANIAQWGLIFGGSRDSDRGGHPALQILMIFLAPIAAMLVQMAISRTREYQADRTGAELMGDPAPLANALNKLDQSSKQIPMQAEPATAHMFIVSPLSGRDMMSLFSTHPPMEKRIAALMELRGQVHPPEREPYSW